MKSRTTPKKEVCVAGIRREEEVVIAPRRYPVKGQGGLRDRGRYGEL